MRGGSVVSSAARADRTGSPARSRPQASKDVGLVAGLDALGDETATGPRGEVLEAGGECLADVVGVDPAHEADVELGEGRSQLEDMAQARVPGPRIVDRQPDIAKSLERIANEAVVVDRDVLGQLEDERPLRLPDELEELAILLEHEPRGDVEREEEAVRERGAALERCADRRQLVVESEPSTGRLGEPDLGWRPVVESGQALETDDVAGREVDDRLEDRVELVCAERRAATADESRPRCPVIGERSRAVASSGRWRSRWRRPGAWRVERGATHRRCG